MDSPSDRDLMLSFGAQGDRAAFEQIVQRWDRRVLSFLAKTCGDLEAAEDLRQEVFIRLYRFGSGYDPRYAFSTWLFRIASNAAKTWAAREGARRRWMAPSLDLAESAPEPADSAPDAHEQAARKETGDLVRGAIAGLEPEERELLLLRFDLDMSYREIAEIRGEPETTIKSRTYKLLETLRGRLACVEPAGGTKKP